MMSMEISGCVTSQSVDLKTSTPDVTDKQKPEKAYGNAREYKNYLSGKYDCQSAETDAIY